MRPDVCVGDSIGSYSYPLTRAHLVRYAGASGDFNPIHWNARFARQVGLPDVIAHGMLTMALGSRAIVEWCGDPGAVQAYGVRFTRPVVVPDDTEGVVVQVSGTVRSRDEQAGTVEVHLAVTCGRTAVLGRAVATVRLGAD